MNFFINKYPIRYALKRGDEFEDLPEGTAFKVNGINGNMLEMKPVKDIGDCVVSVDANILKIGFIEVDYID